MRSDESALEAALPPLLARATRALAAPGQPAAAFAALDAAFDELVGHRLFTVLRFHPESGDVERFHTNQPDAYPVGGRKPLNPTFWTQQVLIERRAYIGRSYADIKAVFFDHELIRSLGCESVLNLPVSYDGRTVGTINLLHQSDWYTQEQVPAGNTLAALAIPGLLS